MKIWITLKTAGPAAHYALDQPDRTPIHVSLQALTTTNPWRGQQ
ncbi:hypothetical protein QPC17_00095 [Trueperella bernardiae]|nr:hypothetical protein [Trueperella bernardiae]WIM07984.1 hypothetical protein QPC17_00095 [Trueperella bernardiae]